VGTYFKEQGSAAEMLIVFSMSDKQRTAEGGIKAFDFILYPRPEAEVFFPCGNIQTAFAVAAGNHHQLCRLFAIDFRDGLH
jgi:hypothetical protein